MDIDRIPKLRPGCELIERHEGSFQIVFGDYTATFSSPPVVHGVSALIEAMRIGNRGRTGIDIVESVAATTGLAVGLVSHVLQLLDSSHCLYWTDGDEPQSSIDQFYAAAGDSPQEIHARLSRNHVNIVCTDRVAPGLNRALHSACISFTSIEVKCADPLEEVEQRILRSCEAGTAMIGVFDAPIRGNLARMVNRLAIERNLPAMFGDCRTSTAQIGPYIVPNTVGCLECLNFRLLSHSPEAEATAIEALRLRYGSTVGEPPPAHPVFLEAMGGVFVCELLNILTFKPSQLLGGFIEVPISGFAAERHSYLKLPRCPCCGTRNPPRFAWNATFSSPDVKNERNVQ